MHGEHRGYHVSYVGYLAEVAKSYFGVINPFLTSPFIELTRTFSNLAMARLAASGAGPIASK